MTKTKKNTIKRNSTKKTPAAPNTSSKPMALQAKVMGAGSGPGDPGDPPSGA